jgi:hypothetical protein
VRIHVLQDVSGDGVETDNLKEYVDVVLNMPSNKIYLALHSPFPAPRAEEMASPALHPQPGGLLPFDRDC